MSGHTPGPWSHYAARLRPQYPLRINEIHGPNGETIVKWSGFDGVSKKRTVTANARLISKAPELLDALIAILPFVATEVLEHCDGNKCREPWCAGCVGEEAAIAAVEKSQRIYQEARTAIASATGVQS